MKFKEKNISFHYTNDQMVKDLISLIPFKNGDKVLDAGSGKNKVWYKNIPKNCKKYECEIEDGKDFLLHNKKYNWIIGNPPFHQGWLFTEKASNLAENGIAFLGNLNFWNSCLPNRFDYLKNKGFYLSKIHIVQDKRWFGRYYFLIFVKKKNKFISWNTKTY
ncbi:MAG: hypothetical protein WC554_04775 [Clostridia bacterium]